MVRIINTICTPITMTLCISKCKSIVPDFISMSHIQNAHIITQPSDYDEKGNLDPAIHELAWKLGGVTKKIGDDIILPKPLTKSELDIISKAVILE